MTINTADGYFGAAKQRVGVFKSGALTTSAGLSFSMWSIAGQPGAGTLAIGNTTTGVLFDDTTAGAPSLQAFGGGATGYLASATFRNTVAGGMTVYDRIWGAGAVNLNALATTSFSSQPAITGRLPGGTGYQDLEILLEFVVAASNTATTVSVGYTNQDGTTGRTTGATTTLASTASLRVIRMPLQAGDKGVQKIDSVTVGGTVATAGSFNVILARRLADLDVRVSNGCDTLAWDALGGAQVFDTTCFWPVVQNDSTALGVPTLRLSVING